MADPELAPETQLLYLLGGMNEKLDGVQREQVVARTESASFRTEVRTEVETLRGEISLVKRDVSVIQSNQKPRATWFQIAGGLSGVAAIIVVVVNYFLK